LKPSGPHESSWSAAVLRAMPRLSYHSALDWSASHRVVAMAPHPLRVVSKRTMLPVA
jgi:hypothetical protein